MRTLSLKLTDACAFLPAIYFNISSALSTLDNHDVGGQRKRSSAALYAWSRGQWIQATRPLPDDCRASETLHSYQLTNRSTCMDLSAATQLVTSPTQRGFQFDWKVVPCTVIELVVHTNAAPLMKTCIDESHQYMSVPRRDMHFTVQFLC